jgi:low affinity Fe/Cu permease
LLHSNDVVQETRPRENEWFRRFAHAASQRLGTPYAFIAALGLVTAWALVGPLFDFSEGWQLVINTGTTIVTFLMVFLIQATQNRDARAIHLKLDELIRATQARDAFADLEDATEEELERLQREFEALRRQGLEGHEAVVQAKQRLRRTRRRHDA